MELWEAAYPVIEQLLTIVEVGGLALGAGKWAASLVRNTRVTPQACFGFQLSYEKRPSYDLTGLLHNTL